MDKRELCLSPRLQCIADCVRAGTRLADVGTDHGYLPVWLLQNGRIEDAIASDIHSAPLERARATAARYDLTEKIRFRLCAGLDGIGPDEADTVVIAGMGGETIVEILRSASAWDWNGVTLFLQPMTKAELLRLWLTENGFAISAERLVRDRGKLYPILTVRAGEAEPLTSAQAWCGTKLGADPLYRDYAMARVRKLETAAAGMRTGGLAEQAAEYAADAAAIRRTVKEWEDANGL